MKELSETKKNDYCNEALDLKKKIEWSFLKLGEMLYKIKREMLFEAGWSSWEEYEMEFKMPSSTISRLIRIYEVFVLRYSFPQAELAGVGWSALAEILPILPETAPRKRAEELLQQVAIQNRQDIRRTIREAKTGISMADCDHDFYTIKICRICGERLREEKE